MPLAPLLLLAAASAHDDGHADPPLLDAPTLDPAALAANPAAWHGREVSLVGRVAWSACRDGGCLAELVSEGTTAPAVLVRSHGPAPIPAAGSLVTVEGRFYTKIYPSYRLGAWQASGWHAGQALPALVEVLRLDASSVQASSAKPLPVAAPPPLAAWNGPVFDLSAAEFESGGMGTGRKCLDPGSATPAHSTGGSQELLFGLSGTLTVEAAGSAWTLGAGQGTLIAAGTEHALRNLSSDPACYLFVYGTPASATP